MTEQPTLVTERLLLRPLTEKMGYKPRPRALVH